MAWGVGGSVEEILWVALWGYRNRAADAALPALHGSADFVTGSDKSSLLPAEQKAHQLRRGEQIHGCTPNARTFTPQQVESGGQLHG